MGENEDRQEELQAAMAHHEAVMKQFGWKKIVSEAQAFQLLRRAIKDYRKLESIYLSRNREVPLWVHMNHAERMLKTKPGNWYRYRQLSPHRKQVEAIS